MDVWRNNTYFTLASRMANSCKYNISGCLFFFHCLPPFIKARVHVVHVLHIELYCVRDTVAFDVSWIRTAYSYVYRPFCRDICHGVSSVTNPFPRKGRNVKRPSSRTVPFFTFSITHLDTKMEFFASASRQMIIFLLVYCTRIAR